MLIFSSSNDLHDFATQTLHCISTIILLWSRRLAVPKNKIESLPYSTHAYLYYCSGCTNTHKRVLNNNKRSRNCQIFWHIHVLRFGIIQCKYCILVMRREFDRFFLFRIDFLSIRRNGMLQRKICFLIKYLGILHMYENVVYFKV